MPGAAQYNKMKITTGADFRQVFRIKDPTQPKIANPNFDSSKPVSASNPKEVYPPKDLTGYTAKMDIRVKADRTSNLIKSLETGSGITIGQPDPADGVIELFIDNTETNVDPILAAAGTDAHYDLFLIAPAPGDVRPIFYGKIKIEKSTTDV